MTIKEFYKFIDGNYDEVVARMAGEERVKKFLPKFLQDKSFEELCDSFEKEDWETAFRAAHSIKGVCANFSFEKLRASSSELVEDLRDGNPGENVTELYNRVVADYREVADALKTLEL